MNPATHSLALVHACGPSPIELPLEPAIPSPHLAHVPLLLLLLLLLLG
jgi:hypothetical protein